MNTFTFVVFCAIFSFCGSAQLPATFKTCKQSQADYSKCLGVAIEDALKQLKNPIPELDLPSLDPLVVNELALPLHHQNIDVEQRIHKLSLSGFSNTKVSHAAVDFNAKTIHFDLMVPSQSSVTDLEWVGTLLGESTKIKAKGTFSAENANLNITAKFEEYEQNGEKYIKIVEFFSQWQVNDPKFSVKSDNKDEAEHINKMLEEHFMEVYHDAEDDYDKLMGNIFLHLANQVFSKVPVKYIFLE